MGFQDEKRWLLEMMQDGTIVHEFRALAADRNWLAQGWISLDEARAIVAATRGDQAENREHHAQPGLVIWIFQPKVAEIRWYVKFHRVGPDRVKILSFHPSERGSS